MSGGACIATMVEIGSRKVGKSDRQSLSSNQHLSGRSAKVSIGIAVEKSPTTVSGVGKEDVPTVQFANKHSACKGVAADSKKHPQTVVNLKTSKVGLKGQNDSECSQSRFSCRETLKIDTGKLYVNPVPALQPTDSRHEKVEDPGCGQKREKGGDAHTDQGLAFTTMQETNVDQEISREKPGEADECTVGILKAKLWEILGGVSSQKEHSMYTTILEENKENIDVDHNSRLRKGKATRCKQGLDPIKTDSDSPNQIIRRPATRSMKRKSAPNKIVKKLHGALQNGNRLLSPTFSDHKHKVEDILQRSGDHKKIFSFDRDDDRMLKQNAFEERNNDTKFRTKSKSSSCNKHYFDNNFKRNCDESISSFDEPEANKSTSEKGARAQSKKLKEKRHATVELRKLHFPSRSSSKSNTQKNDREQLFPSPAKGLLHRKDIESSPFLPRRSEQQYRQKRSLPNNSQHPPKDAQTISGSPLVPKVVASKNVRNLLPKDEKESRVPVNSSSFWKSAFQNDNSPIKNKAIPPDELQSPTLAGIATSTAHHVSSNEITGNPLQTRKITFAWNISSSPITFNDKPVSCGSESNAESSDDTREVHESRDLKSTFVDGKEFAWNIRSSPITFNDKRVSCGSEANAESYDDTREGHESRDLKSTFVDGKEFSWNIRSSPITFNDKRVSCGSEANAESSDDTREVPESRDLKSTFVDGKEHIERLSLSPTLEHDSDSFRAKGLQSKEIKHTSKWFPSFENSEKTPLKRYKRRMIYELEGDETNDLREASDQYIEDNLARVVNQLALALRRFKSKIQLHTNKKCSEILAIVGEEIKQKLQDVDLQIQEDMGQFIGTSKSKRKHLDLKVEEHQERLRLLYGKFKEEVNMHLLNCTEALEELEAQNGEIKRSSDRQKASHRKLFLQIDESMKDQLTAAETSIAAVRKDGRRKLNSLKNALKEWLGEGDIR